VGANVSDTSDLPDFVPGHAEVIPMLNNGEGEHGRFYAAARKPTYGFQWGGKYGASHSGSPNASKPLLG